MCKRLICLISLVLVLSLASNVSNADPGSVWSFTTADFRIIEDFEAYTSTPELYAVWEDWHTLPEGGGEAHLVTSPIHSGAQAMKFKYDWQSGIPVTRRTYNTQQDWSKGGFVALDIWFYGDANDLVNTADDMYVTLGDDDNGDGDVNDKCTIYYVADSGGDGNDLVAKEWMVWYLSLEDFNDGNNVDPNRIKTITLGITGGTTGQIYFDDLRLYVRRCLPDYSWQYGDISGPVGGHPDCFVDYYDLGIMRDEWLTSGTKADLVEDYNVNFKDYTVLMEYWLEDLRWPLED